MSKINQYARLKTEVFTMAKDAEQTTFQLNIQDKHLVVNLLCPEVPSEIEREFLRKNLQPYELAVHGMGHSDYLYDGNQINVAGKREFSGLDLIADNTVESSDTCVVIVVYLQFENQ